MLVYHFEGVPRRPWTVALKNVLTLGLHTKVWLYRVNREMDGHEGFHIDLRWLAVMLWVPFVTPAIVKFQTARRMDIMVAHQVTLPRIRPRTLGWISLVPVLGSGFYAYWVQDILNRHWFWHRRDGRARNAQQRAAELAAVPGSEARRDALAAEASTIAAEVQAELDAARIRLGDEAFEERKRIADEYARRGRMTRKELADIRQKRRGRAQVQRGREAAEKAARPGLLVRLGVKKPKEAIPAGVFVPRKEAPKRTPDEIRAAASAEGREPSRKEWFEIKLAERRLAAMQKEREDRESAQAKERAKLAAREAKAKVKQAQAEEKRRLAAERAAAKAAAKGARKPAKPEKAKPEKGIQVKKGKKKPVPAAAPTLQAGGALKSLTLQCPRCQTMIRNIKKRGDQPARLTCPECGLVGKI